MGTDFCRAKFHVTSIISAVAKMGFSKHTVAKTLRNFCKLRETERILALKPLSLKTFTDTNKSSMMNVSLSEKMS